MLRVLAFLLFAVITAPAGVIGWNWWNHIRIHGASAPVSFVSADGTTLKGDVYLPDGDGPHPGPEGEGPYPGIVILLGSGPDEPQMIDYQVHANAFLKKGVAVLMFDKRGLGRSEGDFETATYADFTEDAIAAVNALRAEPAIDGGRVGLFGFSEGGWFTPEIAVRDGGIKFIINRAGSPFTGGETYLWEIRNELLEGGVTDEVLIKAILDLRLRIWDYYRAAVQADAPLPEERAKLEAELSALDGPWREIYAMRVAEFDAEKYKRWLIDIDYDPMPFLRDMSPPLYAMYAGDDQNIPTDASVKALKTLRSQTGGDITIKVYPGRRHSFFKWCNFLTYFHPNDYLNGIGDWAFEKSMA